MKTVEPIKDLEVIEKIKAFQKKKSKRNYMIFYLGIHTDLNINDLLELRVKDVKDKDFIKIGSREVIIPESIKESIMKYCRNLKRDDYLFHSMNKPRTALHRNTVYHMMKEMEARFGLENLGCQSLRKTFWYHSKSMIAKEFKI